jgi:hypothetical protein
MTDITATDASKRFADLLDAVEPRGETLTVVRRGWCHSRSPRVVKRVRRRLHGRRDG